MVFYMSALSAFSKDHGGLWVIEKSVVFEAVPSISRSSYCVPVLILPSNTEVSVSTAKTLITAIITEMEKIPADIPVTQCQIPFGTGSYDGPMMPREMYWRKKVMLLTVVEREMPVVPAG
ncbi:unnamed protein product [Fusarium graminearum]|nr:unnamed protein product [Fusarium graminearum]